MRVLRFDFDVSKFRGVKCAAELSTVTEPGLSYIIVFGKRDGARRDPLLVDNVTARILELSDGTRTAAQILRQLRHEENSPTAEDDLKWIEDLFRRGLLSLQSVD